MAYTVEAACISQVGKEKLLNGSNLYADGQLLEEGNRGLHRAVSLRKHAEGILTFALLEGQGEDRDAGLAANLALKSFDEKIHSLRGYLMTPREILLRTAEAMNHTLLTERKRASSVAALMTPEEIYICSAGYARAFRLRGSELLQLSRSSECSLGVSAAELSETIYLAKGTLAAGDVFILCSKNLPEQVNALRFFDLQSHDVPLKNTAESLIRRVPKSESAALLLLRIGTEP